MNAWTHTFKNVLTPDEARDLISIAMEYPMQKASVGHGGRQRVDPMRSSNVRWMPRDDANFATLFARLGTRIRRANADTFGFDLADFEDVQFTEYPARRAGKYDWHEDNCWVSAPEARTPFDRKLSCVLLLNAPEDYDGGQLELDREQTPDAERFSQCGDLLIFPSFLRHRVTPVTRGSRFSLVTWVKGPRFR